MKRVIKYQCICGNLINPDEAYEVSAPERCICPPASWIDPSNIPDVCDEFVDCGDGTCKTCEHGKECHEDKK